MGIGKKLSMSYGIESNVGQATPPAELVVTDSTSVNFFKLAVAALKARPSRQKIVTVRF